MAGLDEAELRLLFQKCGPMVMRRAQRLLGCEEDARDAVQEIFVRVLRSAEGFESRSQTTTWLYRITTNYCLTQLRNRRRRGELFEAKVRHALDAPRAAASADLVLLRRLLTEADPQQAQAVVYVYLDGMSHREAAEVMGVAKRTVGNLVERFRAWAHQYVASHSERPPPVASGAGRTGA